MTNTLKLFLLIPVVVFSFCSSKPGNAEGKDGGESETAQKFKVYGKVTGWQGGNLILSELLPGSMRNIDTSAVDASGNFSFDGFLREKTYAMISLGENRSIYIVIDTASNIKVDIDATQPTIKYTFGNCEDCDEIRKFTQLNEQYQMKMASIDAEFQSNPMAGEQKRAELEKRFNEAKNELDNSILQNLSQSKSLFAQIFVIEAMQLSPEKDIEEPIVKRAKEYKSPNKWIDSYLAKAQLRLATAIGSQAPEINQADTAGKYVALSSLKGKVVLVDFWASWCRPCRAENPNVVRLYNQYKGKGFEIYSVSLDQAMQPWKEAIKTDRLTWTHVSDLKYWQSAAAKTYDVQSIPQTFLLDREGKIVAKGLRGAALEEKLKSLLQ